MLLSQVNHPSLDAVHRTKAVHAASGHQVMNLSGDFQGTADFRGADYHRLDENVVTVKAQGQLKGDASSLKFGSYAIDRIYYVSDVETKPFFNGPSATPFDFTMQFRNKKTLHVGGTLIAAPVDGTKIQFYFDGSIEASHGHGTAGTMTAAGVYDIGTPVEPPSFIVYAGGPFQGELSGSVDPAKV